MSVLWALPPRVCIGRSVALSVLCHFNDCSFSLMDDSIHSVTVGLVHAVNWTGCHPVFCHFHYCGFPLNHDSPRVCVHWLRRKSARAGQTGWSAHFLGWNSDGRETGFVLRDECCCGGRCRYVWCLDRLNTGDPVQRGFVCWCRVCALQLCSEWVSWSCSLQEIVLVGLYICGLRQRFCPLGVCACPCRALVRRTSSRECKHSVEFPASLQCLPAHRFCSFTHSSDTFFWDLQEIDKRIRYGALIGYRKLNLFKKKKSLTGCLVSKDLETSPIETLNSRMSSCEDW